MLYSQEATVSHQRFTIKLCGTTSDTLKRLAIGLEPGDPQVVTCVRVAYHRAIGIVHIQLHAQNHSAARLQGGWACAAECSFGPQNFVASGTLLPYRINFENATNATAPAQQVVVSDPLSPNLDWTTLELRTSSWVPLAASLPHSQWRFQCANPATGHRLRANAASPSRVGASG